MERLTQGKRGRGGKESVGEGMGGEGKGA